LVSSPEDAIPQASKSTNHGQLPDIWKLSASPGRLRRGSGSAPERLDLVLPYVLVSRDEVRLAQHLG
jgi:hypothetical protein